MTTQLQRRVLSRRRGSRLRSTEQEEGCSIACPPLSKSLGNAIFWIPVSRGQGVPLLLVTQTNEQGDTPKLHRCCLTRRSPQHRHDHGETKDWIGQDCDALRQTPCFPSWPLVYLMNGGVSKAQNLELYVALALVPSTKSGPTISSSSLTRVIFMYICIVAILPMTDCTVKACLPLFLVMPANSV